MGTRDSPGAKRAGEPRETEPGKQRVLRAAAVELPRSLVCHRGRPWRLEGDVRHVLEPEAVRRWFPSPGPERSGVLDQGVRQHRAGHQVAVLPRAVWGWVDRKSVV